MISGQILIFTNCPNLLISRLPIQTQICQQSILHYKPQSSYRNNHRNFVLQRMGEVVTETQFHVLAVDDSLIDRKLIERLLKTSSYQVTAVDSGVKALEYLGLLDDEGTNNRHEVEVNLIITDYCMPEITGYDLLRKIKGSTSLKDIPVVIMSSENVPSRINSCLEEGAEEFFLKPVRQSDVDQRKEERKWIRGRM